MADAELQEIQETEEVEDLTEETSTEETSTEEESTEETVEEKVEETPERDSQMELQLLRQISRDQKKDLIELKEQLSRQQELLKEKGVITDEDTQVDEEGKAAASMRASQLEMFAEAMRVNPKYEDIDDVVSQAHFDDYVEAVARAYVEKNGGDFNQISGAIEARIWGMANPYRFLYTEIKKWHPAYAQKESKGEAKTETTQTKSASSIADLPGGGASKAGWTAARIDSLPEEELDKVPPDVYAKYLRNELK